MCCDCCSVADVHQTVNYTSNMYDRVHWHYVTMSLSPCTAGLIRAVDWPASTVESSHHAYSHPRPALHCRTSTIKDSSQIYQFSDCTTCDESLRSTLFITRLISTHLCAGLLTVATEPRAMTLKQKVIKRRRPSTLHIDHTRFVCSIMAAKTPPTKTRNQCLAAVELAGGRLRPCPSSCWPWPPAWPPAGPAR